MEIELGKFRHGVDSGSFIPQGDKQVKWLDRRVLNGEKTGGGWDWSSDCLMIRERKRDREMMYRHVMYIVPCALCLYCTTCMIVPQGVQGLERRSSAIIVCSRECASPRERERE